MKQRKKTVFCAAGVLFGFLLLFVFGAFMAGFGPGWLSAVYLALLFPANALVAVLFGIFNIPVGNLGWELIPLALSIPAFYGALGFYIGGKF